MASRPSWPQATGFALADGFQETWPELAERSSVDAGPAKQRAVASDGPSLVRVAYVMTTVERNWLELFYKGQAAGGGVWFNWWHPVKQATMLARFMVGAPPSYEPRRPLWTVSVTLEVRSA